MLAINSVGDDVTLVAAMAQMHILMASARLGRVVQSWVKSVYIVCLMLCFHLSRSPLLSLVLTFSIFI